MDLMATGCGHYHVTFMSTKFDLCDLRTRIEQYFHDSMTHLGDDAPFLMKVVRALADEGEFKRSYVQELLGRGETFSRRIIQTGISEGLIATPRPNPRPSTN
mgnify:FL=1